MEPDIAYLYNKNNTIIKFEDLNNIFKLVKIKYVPKDIQLFITAFTHISYTKTFFVKSKNYNIMFQKYVINNNLTPDTEYTVELQDESYDRLEFLGDSLINMFISEYLFLRYPDANEHFLSSLKRTIQSNNTLGQISKYLHLDKFILISKIEEAANARIDPEKKILGDVLEAFIGALYIDSKCIKVCKNFFINAFENSIDICQLILKRDISKTKLQYNISNVIFERIKRTPINNKPCFTVIAKINNEIYGIGTSNTVKHAEEEAANMALAVLNDN